MSEAPSEKGQKRNSALREKTQLTLVKNRLDLQNLKGLCHKIFHQYFFNDSNPSGPLINRLKYYWIWF